MNDFTPYSKAEQLHQIDKDVPVKSKRFGQKKRKKRQVVKGREIPTRRQRSTITKKEYAKAIDTFGDCCMICGDNRIEMHHITYRSASGRGGFRNLLPLCNEHHRLAHSTRAFSDMLKEQRITLYGKYFHCDKYDLFKMNLIKNTTNEEFEKFMEGEKKHE